MRAPKWVVSDYLDMGKYGVMVLDEDNHIILGIASP